MYGNGAAIGMAIILLRRKQILKVHQLAHIECFAVVVGIISVQPVTSLVGNAFRPIVAAKTKVFVLFFHRFS